MERNKNYEQINQEKNSAAIKKLASIGVALVMLLAIGLTTPAANIRAAIANVITYSHEVVTANFDVSPAWTVHTSLDEGYTLSDVWGSSASDVFAVGYDNVAQQGVIFHYNGSIWTLAYVTPFCLDGVWGTAWNDVWAVGGGGVFHYDGLSWGLTSYTLMAHDVWASPPSDVFVVGHLLWIAHYNGSTWSQTENPSHQWLYGVWGTSPTDVWAVGQMGTILHYNGTSWTDMGWPWGDGFQDVWGSAWNDVYVVSGMDAVHYDGSSWDYILTSPSPSGEAVWGRSADDIFAVGGSGRIYHYDGADWTLMTSPTSATLQGVWGSSPTDVWAVGDYGNILHYGPPPPICGDVNCSGGEPDMFDVIDLLYYVGYPGQYTICSKWAADVNCSGGEPDMFDVIDLLYFVGYPGQYALSCCPP